MSENFSNYMDKAINNDDNTLQRSTTVRTGRLELSPQEKRNRQRLKMKVNTNPDHANETQLTKEFLDHFITEEFKYAIEIEWEFEDETGKGAGDLVFSDTPNISFKSRDKTDPTSARILIVEVKHIDPLTNNDTNRRKRKKVREEVVRAMDCWHKYHPQDVVFGMVVSNTDVNYQDFIQLPGVSVFISPMFQSDTFTNEGFAVSVDHSTETLQPYVPEPFVKYFGIPVLRTAWGSTQRSHIDHSLWNAIKQAEFQRTQNKCEFCELVASPEEVMNKLTVHMAWKYDEESKVASFARYDVLCTVCHEFMHMGRAQAQGAEKVNHLLSLYSEIKKITIRQTMIEYLTVWNTHYSLSSNNSTPWTVDLSGIQVVPAARNWLQKNDNMVCERGRKITASRKFANIGNCCCYSECNPQYHYESK